jgi:GNAT superfamily N-acetyltransferase
VNGFEPWGADRVGDLVDLLGRVAPHEDLTADELLTACHEQSGIVVAATDGASVVSVGSGRDVDGALIASVRLLVVDIDFQRAGRGSALLDHAESWAIDRGASRIVAGGSLPFSLWPGVPESSPLEALAAARGYVVEAEWDSVEVPVLFRSDAPDGVVIRRAVHDDDVTRVLLASAALWPRLSDEIARALEHGTCHVAITAVDGEDVVAGVGCHSVTRSAWAGPLIVDPQWRRRGVGRALLGQICRDLMIAEFPTVVIPEVRDDGVSAFLEGADAKTTIRYRRMVKQLA